MIVFFEKNIKFYIFLYFFIFFLGLIRVHVRVQTTIIGYELGKLKSQEIELIHKKNRLTMHLEKITTKQSLLKTIGP
jgi:hypothetical protein